MAPPNFYQKRRNGISTNSLTNQLQIRQKLIENLQKTRKGVRLLSAIQEIGSVNNYVNNKNDDRRKEMTGLTQVNYCFQQKRTTCNRLSVKSNDTNAKENRKLSECNEAECNNMPDEQNEHSFDFDEEQDFFNCDQADEVCETYKYQDYRY